MPLKTNETKQMIPKSAKLRVARPTDNLAQITQMYVNGLGFELLGEFKGHNGFNGSIIGHAKHNYHLEFTHHIGTKVGHAPSKDNLLVFYFSANEIFDILIVVMTVLFALGVFYNSNKQNFRI